MVANFTRYFIHLKSNENYLHVVYIPLTSILWLSSHMFFQELYFVFVVEDAGSLYLKVETFFSSLLSFLFPFLSSFFSFFSYFTPFHAGLSTINQFPYGPLYSRKFDSTHLLLITSNSNSTPFPSSFFFSLSLFVSLYSH